MVRVAIFAKANQHTTAPNASVRSPRVSLPCGWLKRCALAAVYFVVVFQGKLSAQDVDIWEYSPYKVQVWFNIDPAIDKSATAQAELVEQVRNKLRATYAATWDFDVLPVPGNMHALVERGLGSLVVDDFSNADLVLLIDKSDDSLKTLRVFDTAVEQLPKIAMTKADHAQLQVDIQPYMASFEGAGKLLEKTTELYETYFDIVAALREKTISALLVPKSQLPMFVDRVRTIATVLPWHTERFVREYEKLLIVSCNRSADLYSVDVRELDCSMRLFGPTMHAEIASWKALPQLVADETVKAFAPVVRIEEANGKIVQMLNRAGGLAEANNPVRIQPGDVLQPVIRREDRRGATPLLEPIPWTYIAVTATDGIQSEGTTLSALGNVLQGKQSRRAQRVALRVRPLGTQSDVKVVTRTLPVEAQPGCQIYERDLLTEELRYLGNTDWRGVITIDRPDPPGSILPEKLRLERQAAKKAAADAAAKAAEAQAAKAAEEKKQADAAQGDNKPKEDEDVRGNSTQTAPTGANVEGAPAVPTTTPVPEVAASSDVATAVSTEVPFLCVNLSCCCM